MANATVVQLANDQLTKAKDAQKAAATALAAAKKTAQDAAAKIAAIGNDLAAEHAKGRELQGTPRPTAAAARELLRKQEEHEIRLHALTAKLAAAREEAARAEALDAEAQGVFTRVQARVAELERAKKRVDSEAAAWQNINDLVQKVRDRAVSIPDAVDALKASDTYKQAEARVNAEVPQKLREEGRKRAEDARKKTKQAIDEEDAALATLATKNKDLRGKLGEVVPAQLAFEVSQRRVREIAGAAAELDQIKTQLEAIAKPLAPTAATETADIEAAGTKALNDLPGLRNKVTDAARKVTDQEKLIEDKKKEIAAPPAGADPAVLQADLQKLEGDLPGLKTKVTQAEEKVQAALDDVNRWEAAVPEEAWQRLLMFDQANRRLAELKANYTPAKIDALRNDLVTAEQNLVTALENEAAARSELETAEIVAARNKRLATAAREVHDVNQLAAVRGDV